MEIFGCIQLSAVIGVGRGMASCVARYTGVLDCRPKLRCHLYRCHLFGVFSHKVSISCYLLARCVRFDAIFGIRCRDALVLSATPVIAMVMGVMSVTFGAIIRDVLGGDVPLLPPVSQSRAFFAFLVIAPSLHSKARA